MSDAIRRAIIELEIRLKQGGINSPDISAAKKAYDDLAQAAKAADAAMGQGVQAGRNAGETAKTTSAAVDAWTAGMRRLNQESRAHAAVLADQVAGANAWSAGLQKIKKENEAVAHEQSTA